MRTRYWLLLSILAMAAGACTPITPICEVTAVRKEYLHEHRALIQSTRSALDQARRWGPRGYTQATLDWAARGDALDAWYMRAHARAVRIDSIAGPCVNR